MPQTQKQESLAPVDLGKTSGTSPTKSEWMQSEDVCAELGISAKTLSRLRKRKAIGFIVVNAGSYRYHRQRHFDAFVRSRESMPR